MSTTIGEVVESIFRETGIDRKSAVRMLREYGASTLIRNWIVTASQGNNPADVSIVNLLSADNFPIKLLDCLEEGLLEAYKQYAEESKAQGSVESKKRMLSSFKEAIVGMSQAANILNYSADVCQRLNFSETKSNEKQESNQITNKGA